MADAYIIDAVRTPRGGGKPGKGALSHLHPQHLAATVLKAIAERNKLDTATVDDIIWSTSTQKGKQGGDLGRMAALDAGYDIRSSGMTLDSFCGGGITSVNLAAGMIMSGLEDCIIAGGTEMMSLTTTMAQEERAAGMAPMVRSRKGRNRAVTMLPVLFNGCAGFDTDLLTRLLLGVLLLLLHGIEHAFGILGIDLAGTLLALLRLLGVLLVLLGFVLLRVLVRLVLLLVLVYKSILL